MDKQKKASIKDVAREAGVPLAIVSRVISHLDSVKPAVQRRVTDATEKLGYSPNYAARVLVTRRANAISIIVDSLHDPFFYDLVEGFKTGARQTSYSVIFCSVLSDDVKSKGTYIRYLSNGVVGAVILYGSYLNDENVIKCLHEGSKMEYVTIKNDTPSITCNKLLTNNLDETREAIHYFIQEGRRRTAYICGNLNRMVTMDQFNDYIQSMQEVRPEVLGSYIQYTSTGCKSGRDRVEALLELPMPPNVVFCSDDAIADYAARAVMDVDFQVPEDISVMGFDNRRVLPNFYRGPVITSVEQPLYTIGIDSIRLLGEHLDRADLGQAMGETHKTRIIEKETVGKYR